MDGSAKLTNVSVAVARAINAAMRLPVRSPAML
jgi:hypothetical protein